MEGMTLSPDQLQALDRLTAALAVRNGVPSVLVGPAGTNLCRDRARPGEGRRMLYTAVTRARTGLHLFDVRRRR